ncbi:LysR family transcriptional regulator [Candidimonas nitroreducens]|uniref:LysR family transcriptional regulator n=1 Tax=Candidimonas nitroreducens TaxID=683354 RepID=UPI0013034FE0|nr:LysR family transcriptional regulator [Candidimonas nitroreducens]
MRNINLANLETAFWIARLGSFTAAAERLYTTQPAISARMRELEAALGVKLFVRVGRGVELTMEGRKFLEDAEPIFQQFEALTGSVNSAYASGGTVRIGAGNISMSWFPNMIREMQRIVPDLTYDVEIDLAGKVLQKLEVRKLDIAIVAGPVHGDKLSSAPLGYDRMLWVASAEFLTENWAGNLLEFLRTAPIWCVQRESFYWTEAMRIIMEGGGNPRHFNGISNMAAAHQIVLGGGGVGCLSSMLIRQDLEAGTLQLIPDLRQGGWVEFSVACVAESRKSKIISQIMDMAQASSTLKRQRD